MAFSISVVEYFLFKNKFLSTCIYGIEFERQGRRTGGVHLVDWPPGLCSFYKIKYTFLGGEDKEKERDIEISTSLFIP